MNAVNKAEKSKQKPRPEHERLGDAIIRGLPRAGMVLFVTFRPPESECSGKLHEDFARFCAQHTEHFIAVLEYGPPPYDLADLFDEDGHGEHVHAIVWVEDDVAFAAAAHAWATKMKIDKRARDWEVVTGWLRYRDHGRIRPSAKGRTKGYLRSNLIKVISYITKPSKGGQLARDFVAHGIARGLFADGWHVFCNETASRPSVTDASWFCPVCWNRHLKAKSVTGRPRVYCGGTCRKRAHDRPAMRDPHRRYTLMTRGGVSLLVRG